MTDPLKASLLVVEDDDAQRAEYAVRFRELGYAVETAASAEEAIAFAERKAFDVILTDNVLPGMTGLASIPRLIRRSVARVFLMTSHPSAVTEEDALLLGAVACLPKPLNFLQAHVRFRRAADGVWAYRARHGAGRASAP